MLTRSDSRISEDSTVYLTTEEKHLRAKPAKSHIQTQHKKANDFDLEAECGEKAAL